MIIHLESLDDPGFENVNFLILGGFSPSEVLVVEIELDLESEELLELLSDDIADVELKKVWN